jgi:methylated-DNA-[protein]-cysteine S-methyltransferase
MTLYNDLLDSPVGELHLASDGRSLRALSFRALPREYLGERARDPQGFTSLLRAYFAGDLDALDRIPCDGQGTEFQRAVWAQLRRIRRGSTLTYGELAARLGKPGASRAVGLANGQNPIAIVVPCHRVIGAGGKLTGYGGGLDKKRWLLRHEGALLA